MLTSPLLSGAGFSRNTTEMAAIRPAVFVSASCQPAREQGNRSNAVDGSTQSRNLSCLHCDFKCQLGSEMTQHRWQEHPLLMRRKQHLMSSSIVNRKRQLSETMVGQVSPHGKSESADADNCGKARKVKTDMCDVAEQAKQEGMDHTKATSEENFNLSKHKSSSLDDISSIANRLDVSDQNKKTDCLSLIDGLAAGPLVAFYQKHVADCITASLMQQPAYGEPKHPNQKNGNFRDVSTRPSTSPDTSRHSTVAFEPERPSPDRHEKNTRFDWPKQAGSAHVSPDDLSHGYVAASPGLYRGSFHASTVTGSRAVNEVFGANSTLPELLPYAFSHGNARVGSRFTTEAGAHQPALPGCVSTTLCNQTGHGAAEELVDVVGDAPSTSETRYANKLSALSDVASQILISDRGASLPFVRATSCSVFPKRPENSRSPVSESKRENFESAMCAGSGDEKHFRQDTDCRNQSQITELTLALQREKISQSNSPPTVHRRLSLERHPASSAMMDDRRVKSLKEAVRHTDCCDPSMHSNVLPFRCTDGTWKMVRTKRIGGAWLIQMPGRETASVVIPPAEVMKAAMKQSAAHPGNANVMSVSNLLTGHACKRSLTSAPYPGLGQAGFNMPSGSALKSLLLQKS